MADDVFDAEYPNDSLKYKSLKACTLSDSIFCEDDLTHVYLKESSYSAVELSTEFDKLSAVYTQNMVQKVNSGRMVPGSDVVVSKEMTVGKYDYEIIDRLELQFIPHDGVFPQLIEQYEGNVLKRYLLGISDEPAAEFQIEELSCKELMFTACEEGAVISMTTSDSAVLSRLPSISLVYSLDFGKTWHNFIQTNQGNILQHTPIVCHLNQSVLLKAADGATNTFCYSGSWSPYFRFDIQHKVKASGNVMSLVRGDCPTTLSSNYCFSHLFERNYGLLTAPELCATELTKGCFFWMFDDCYNMRSGPSVLPAKDIPAQAYWYMFSGCHSLVVPPKVLAEKIATGNNNALFGMFQNCEMLTALELPELSSVGTGKSIMDSIVFSDPAEYKHSHLQKISIPKISAFNYYEDAPLRQLSTSPFYKWMRGIDGTISGGTFECCRNLLSNESHIGINTCPRGWTFAFSKYVVFPTASDGIVYDGHMQSCGISDTEEYHVFGQTSAVEVGDYVISVELDDGYEWLDSDEKVRKIQWSILE